MREYIPPVEIAPVCRFKARIKAPTNPAWAVIAITRCSRVQNKIRKYAKELTGVLFVLIKDNIHDLFGAVGDLVVCFPDIRVPQFVFFSKSVFYFEGRKGLMYVGSASALVTGMYPVLFAA